MKKLLCAALLFTLTTLTACSSVTAYTNIRDGFTLEYRQNTWAVIDSSIMESDSAAVSEFFTYSTESTRDIVEQQLEAVSSIFLSKSDGIKSSIDISITHDTGGKMAHLRSGEQMQELEDYYVSAFEPLVSDLVVSQAARIETYGKLDFLVLQMDYSLDELSFRRFQAVAIDDSDGDMVFFTFVIPMEDYDRYKSDIDVMLKSFKFIG